jgi:hypothetical protein
MLALTLALCCGASAQEKTYKFELSEKAVQAIAGALAKAPYEVAAPVLAELQKQINEQQKPPAEQPK